MQSVTVIIPAADKDAENQWMQANIDHAAGQYSFTAALTPDGSTISHYWFSNNWPDDKASLLKEHFTQVYTGTPQEVLTNLGLQTIKGAV